MTMMERRDFVRTLGAAALGQVLQPRTPSPYPRAPLRKLDRIGLQLYTVRHQMEKDFEGTIARVAAIGYREVEFAGYFGRTPRDVRALLDHHGLSAPSSHVSLAPEQWRGALDAAPIVGDLYWIVKGGQDPLAYFARWPGRFPMVHVKDSAGPPDHRMVEVGAGKIDFKKIFAQRDQAGIQHFFVEHDEPADPFASIRASYEYLKHLEF